MAEGETILAGHDAVEHNEVDTRSSKDVAHLYSIGGHIYDEAMSAQLPRNKYANFLIIVYHEDVRVTLLHS
ncbi:protein of unknown function [Candidatus Filomicrobium marinum]|uniref:Uncharacterized protein n=1 Tax=Candidatus Filomicrobium marinum TaxID=1608628 RepID=A0A0D6JFA3_9HYPH|nr:protein of unknown function [Candidatus Filomicrobium marinum]CPR19086.1 protein of unknown function [Candidatus Filomicrobium marinum]